MNSSGLKSDPTTLTQQLIEMNAQGGFLTSVLADRDGFPIAAAVAPGQETDKQSAVVALVQRTALQVREQIGMAETDEIVMDDAEGRRLVCRPFTVNGYMMILAILIPNKHQSYRRLTNQTVNAIRQFWKV